MKQTNLHIDKQRLAEICRRYDVQRMALFGSVLREDFGPDSDVDILVEFKPGKTPGFGFIRLENELSELVGRQVDLVTYKALNRHVRDDVLGHAEECFAQEG